MLTRTSLTSAALVAGLAGLVFAPAVSSGAWLGSKQDDRYTLTYDAGAAKAGAAGSGAGAAAGGGSAAAAARLRPAASTPAGGTKRKVRL